MATNFFAGGFGNVQNSLFSSGGFNYSDWAMIKSGAYRNLMKAYYGGNKTAKKLVDNKASDNKATTNSAEKVNATNVRDNADALSASAKKLSATDSKKTLFNKKEFTDKDGKVKEDYDWNEVYKAVESFTKDYNSLLDSAGDSENKSVLRSTSNMVSTVKANEKLLKKIGITIGSNNKLSIDKDKFMASDMSDVKTLFNGTHSMGATVGNTAAQVNNQAKAQLAQMGNSLYSSSGKYSYSGYNTYNQYS